MRTTRIVGVLALALCGIARAEPAPGRSKDPLADEQARRDHELIQQHFAFTQGLTLGGNKSLRLELVIGSLDDEHDDNTIALWFETAHGRVAVKLTGPHGDVLTAWQARKGEQRLARPLAAGKYVLEVTPLEGATVYGLAGVLGPVVTPCELDPRRVSEHAADPQHGFHWPYLLISALPRPQPTAAEQAAQAKQIEHTQAHLPIGASLVGPSSDDYLLVAPNNTGFATESLPVLRESARCDAARWLPLADKLGTHVLVPLFPRPTAPAPAHNLYLHALSRAALTIKSATHARVDRQLIAMIDHAEGELARQGHHVDPRVLLAGHSAAAMFVNRFVVLHPDRVLAAAIAEPGGWPIAPVVSERGKALTYPVGIADLAQLDHAPDLGKLRAVPQLFLIGADETNDAVPSRDAFSSDDEATITKLFGATPVARWPAAERLYQQAKLDARFVTYPDTGHEVSAQMMADIADLFGRVIEQLSPSQPTIVPPAK